MRWKTCSSNKKQDNLYLNGFCFHCILWSLIANFTQTILYWSVHHHEQLININRDSAMVKTAAACFHRVQLSCFLRHGCSFENFKWIKNTKQAGSALHVYNLVRVCAILRSCTVIILLFFLWPVSILDVKSKNRFCCCCCFSILGIFEG